MTKPNEEGSGRTEGIPAERRRAEPNGEDSGRRKGIPAGRRGVTKGIQAARVRRNDGRESYESGGTRDERFEPNREESRRTKGIRVPRVRRNEGREVRTEPRGIPPNEGDPSPTSPEERGTRGSNRTERNPAERRGSESHESGGTRDERFEPNREESRRTKGIRVPRVRRNEGREVRTEPRGIPPNEGDPSRTSPEEQWTSGSNRTERQTKGIRAETAERRGLEPNEVQRNEGQGVRRPFEVSGGSYAPLKKAEPTRHVFGGLCPGDENCVRTRRDLEEERNGVPKR
ncbi:hypothetical protein DFH11DRAFT_1550383 [Phellopilus nigrolimitatus]|nr:hypothetical protein DFH11DRAFT_1550383 [Phellopilus nigrolimitatus]